MATGISGSVAFSGSGKTLRVYYKQTYTPGVGQSTVTIPKITIQGNSNYGGTFFFDGTIKVNGTTIFSADWKYSGCTCGIGTGESTISGFGGASVVVQHTNATAISISVGGTSFGYVYFYNSSYDSNSFSISASSQSITLSAIPMASTISASSGTLGTAQTITLKKAASSLTDTVTWTCGSASGTIATKTSSTSLSWTPPLSLASQNTTGTAVSVKLTTQTYSGSTLSGSSSVTISCAIPTSVVPSVAFTVADASGYCDTYGGYLRSLSQAKLTITASGSYDSTITATQSMCGSVTASGSAPTFDLPTAGTVTLSVTVTDSRGRTATASQSITVTDYEKPVPSITSLYRTDSVGTAAPAGAYARATAACTYTALNDENALTLTLQYRVRGTDTWTKETISTDEAAVFSADTGSAYEARLKAADNFSTAYSDIMNLPAAFALMDFDRDNKAVGIGQYAGTSSTVAVGLPVAMGGNRITDVGTPTDEADAATKAYVDSAPGELLLKVYPVGAIYISVDSTSPATLFGGTWEQLTDRFLVGAGSSYAVNATGGEATHKLTASEMPSHTHGQGGYTWLWGDKKGTVYATASACSGASPSSGNYLYTKQNTAGWCTTNSTGSGSAHNNLPPYLAVYMWKRTA